MASAFHIALCGVLAYRRSRAAPPIGKRAANSRIRSAVLFRQSVPSITATLSQEKARAETRPLHAHGSLALRAAFADRAEGERLHVRQGDKGSAGLREHIHLAGPADRQETGPHFATARFHRPLRALRDVGCRMPGNARFRSLALAARKIRAAVHVGRFRRLISPPPPFRSPLSPGLAWREATSGTGRVNATGQRALTVLHDTPSSIAFVGNRTERIPGTACRNRLARCPRGGRRRHRTMFPMASAASTPSARLAPARRGPRASCQPGSGALTLTVTTSVP